MGIQLNHTIVHSKDKHAAAKFLSEILGLPPPEPWYHFLVVRTTNGVSLDFLEHENPEPQHYAFLVTEKEFDEIFGRIKAWKLEYWADPACTQAGKINDYYGGRGCYFKDPSGHFLEIITKPYGAEE